MIVANKSDLPGDPDLPLESLEATAIFDWENGYVECSAKERKNINKIFKELLNQSKSRFDLSVPSPRSRSPLSSLYQKGPKTEAEDALKRRLSLPTTSRVPNGTRLQTPKIIEEDEVFNNSPKRFPTSPGGKRRSSLAVLSHETCRIS